MSTESLIILIITRNILCCARNILLFEPSAMCLTSLKFSSVRLEGTFLVSGNSNTGYENMSIGSQLGTLWCEEPGILMLLSWSEKVSKLLSERF